MTRPPGLHADRPVRLETRCAETVVVKRYLAGGAAAIHDQMAALWSSSFGEHRRPPGLPRPMGVNRAHEELEMQLLPGQAIGSRGDLGPSVQLLPEVARLLADLHGSGVVVPRRRDPAALLRSARRKVDELGSGAANPCVYLLAKRVVDDLAGALPGAGELVVGHGDFSPRNVLSTPSGLALIDFDRLQMAAPERDISYWGAWTWVTLLIGGQPPGWQVAEALATAYRRSRPVLAAPDAPAWSFYRVVALLRIVHGWSALQTTPQLSLRVLTEACRLLS